MALNSTTLFSFRLLEMIVSNKYYILSKFPDRQICHSGEMTLAKLTSISFKSETLLLLLGVRDVNGNLFRMIFLKTKNMQSYLILAALVGGVRVDLV